MINRASSLLCLTATVLFGLSISIAAQQPSTAFTYQGQLSNNGVPGNGSFDLQFKLFDISQNGSQQGATVTLTNVSVVNGIFAVQLDFGEIVFIGNSAQFLEIGVRPGGSAASVLFTVLAPRVPITPTPYSVRAASAASADSAVSATQLGGVAANQFVQTNDSRLTDSRDPTAGSANYIQNGTSQQSSSNFNITGNGTAGGTLSGNVVNATTQYSLGGSSIIRANIDSTTIGIGAGAIVTNAFSTFVGAGAGSSNTSGKDNSFFGYEAGISNTTGVSNSFFGFGAGANNIASVNSFFGTGSGVSNTSGTSNSFFGFASGASNSTDSNNSFFGSESGRQATGSSNSFFGSQAGFNNTGTGNSFFGAFAGKSNTTGFSNSFFGSSAGMNNTGLANSFFGAGAGMANTTAINNSFFGQAAGFKNTTGQDNTFMGNGAGLSNTTANSNTIVGSLSGQFTTTGGFNAFFGFQAGNANVGGNDNSIFGASAGVANIASANSFFGTNSGIATTVGDFNSFVGVSSGLNNVDGHDNSFLGGFAGLGNTSGFDNTAIGHMSGQLNTTGSSNTYIGAFAGPQNGSGNLTQSTAIGANSTVIASHTIVLGTNAETTNIPGSFSVAGLSVFSTLGSAGSTALCRNASNQLATCSSSLRYKTDLAPYRRGLELINRLQPISFTWKDGGMRDMGFGAEDVAKIEPLLATYNTQGQVEGLKYDRITVALVNAVKEQQAKIDQQQTQIDSLKRLVCADHPGADVCK